MNYSLKSVSKSAAQRFGATVVSFNDPGGHVDNVSAFGGVTVFGVPTANPISPGCFGIEINVNTHALVGTLPNDITIVLQFDQNWSVNDIFDGNRDDSLTDWVLSGGTQNQVLTITL